MNQRIQKTIEEIERAKAKIAELQTLLPELERKRTDLENTEIVRLMRSADVAPVDIAAFIESIKTGRQDSKAATAPPARTGNPGGNIPPSYEEETDDDEG